MDKSIIKTNENIFGRVTKYKRGEVCVWRGNTPAIGRLVRDYDFSGTEAHVQECACFESGDLKSYNSLHFHNLRPATEEEIEFLGNNTLIILGESKK